jgi:hypothetical protein
MKILIALIAGVLGCIAGAGATLIIDNYYGRWGGDIASSKELYTVTSAQVVEEDVYLTIAHPIGEANTKSERLELRGYRIPAIAFAYPSIQNLLHGKKMTKLKVEEARRYKVFRLLE